MTNTDATPRRKVTLFACPAPNCMVTREDPHVLAEHVNEEHEDEWNDSDWPEPQDAPEHSES